MLRYYITDRKQLASDDDLLDCVMRACAAGVKFACLREKDLNARELEALAYRVRAAVTGATKFIVHSRPDIAIAVGADGVHLASGADELNPGDVRALWLNATSRNPVIVVSCHTVEEVAWAESQGADLAVFGPVFEKSGVPNPDGLERLRQVCHRNVAARPPMPILALGGVTDQNAEQCMQAGAAGIAGIRLFQQTLF